MKVLPTREGFVEDATFLRTSEGCALVKVLPTREGFVDATFLRTSEGCALVKVLPTCEGRSLWRMSRF